MKSYISHIYIYIIFINTLITILLTVIVIKNIFEFSFFRKEGIPKQQLT